MAAPKRAKEKTAVVRLVLCKAFLANAAVCLDSAARRWGVALKILRSQNRALFWARNQAENR
jgi:hypothetical protein